MNELITKKFKDNTVRIIVIDNKEWFVAKDIAELLGYKRTRDAISDHCKKSLSYDDLLGGGKTPPLDSQTKMILEPDVWRLVIKSRLPEAEKIENWLFEEVLPSIRKTGSYSLSQDSDKTETEEKISVKEIQELNQYLSEFIKMAHLCEFKGNQAILSADKGVRNITGHSPLKLLDEIHLVANEKTKIFTPTQLGKEIGKTAMEMNLLLADIDFQKKVGKIWEVLESGLEFAELLDTNKKHSDGTPVKQIKWQKEVLEKIKI